MSGYYALIATVVAIFVNIQNAAKKTMAKSKSHYFFEILFIILSFVVLLVGPGIVAVWFCYLVSDDPSTILRVVCYFVSIFLFWHLPPIAYFWVKRKKLGWSFGKAAWYHFAVWSKYSRG